MQRRLVENRQWLLALLIVALLGGMAHAAEFGAGQHSHDGVACSFGLGSDDDLGLSGSIAGLVIPIAVAVCPPLYQRHTDGHVDAFLPPSTGPPIAGADFVFDVHSGDGAEWLETFVGVYGGPLSSKYEQALAVAEATGFENIVRYSMNYQEQVDTRRSLNRQAVAAGAPTVLLETGENGRRDDEDVERIVTGLRRALGVLGMLPEQPGAAPVAPRYFDGTQSVRAGHSGLWTPAPRTGQLVEKGDVLGSIRDYQGKLVETLTAPVSGYPLYGLAGPPIRSGDSVMSIALPVSALD